jgi:tetratricopeptide (TPR) repeat protein
MAVMYQKHGMVKEWVECSRKAATMKGNDFMTCYNIASLISLGADVEEGLRVFTTSDDASPMYIYYRGIIQFYHDDAAWRQSLRTYLNKSKKGDKDDGHLDLAEVMTAKDFKLDSAGYKSAMDIQPYELEYQLLSIKAKNSLSNNIYPTMQLADLCARKKCFEKALQTLAEIKDSPKSATQDSTYRFHLAYVQYMSGDKKGSVENWKLLLNSGNFFRQSAACYFLGEIYKSQGKAKEAKELFEKVADRASDSKFANFCKAERK